MEVENFSFLPHSKCPRYFNHTFKEKFLTKSNHFHNDLVNVDCSSELDVIQCISSLVERAVWSTKSVTSNDPNIVKSNIDENIHEVKPVVSSLLNQVQLKVDKSDNLPSMLSKLPQWFYSPFELSSWLKDPEYSCLTSTFHKACFQLGMELVILKNLSGSSSNSNKTFISSDDRIHAEEMDELYTNLSNMNKCYQLKQLICTICNSYKTESLNVMEHHLLMPHYKDTKLRLMMCSQCSFRSNNHQEFFTHFLSQHQRVPYFIPFLHSQMCTRCPHEVNCRRSFLRHQEYCMKSWTEKNLGNTNQAPMPEDEFDHILKTAYPNFTPNYGMGLSYKDKDHALYENMNHKTRATRTQPRVSSISSRVQPDHVLVCPHCNGMLLSIEDFMMHMKRAHPNIPITELNAPKFNMISSNRSEKHFVAGRHTMAGSHPAKGLTNGTASRVNRYNIDVGNTFHGHQNEQYEMTVPTTFSAEISSLKSQFHDAKVSNELDTIISRLVGIYGSTEWMNSAQLLEVKSLSGECRKCLKGFILNIVEHQKNVHHRTLEHFGSDLTCIICFQQFSTRGELIDHQHLSHHLVALCSLNRLYQIKIDAKAKGIPEKAQTSRFQPVQGGTNNVIQMPKKFFCKKCLVTGLDFNALCNHLETVHDVGVKVMRPCEICGGRFSRGAEMNAHQRAHLIKCRIKFKRLKEPNPLDLSCDLKCTEHTRPSSPEIIVLDDN